MILNHKRVGAMSDLGVLLVVVPIVILVSVSVLNIGGSPISVFFQGALYVAVLIGAIAAGVLANLTGPTDVGAHWGPQAFLLAALGGIWGVATAANANLLLLFGPFLYLYGMLGLSFVLGLVLWVGQAGSGGS